MPSITLSIVGTAGRNEDGDKLSRSHFDAMYIIANTLVDTCKRNNYEITTLVSGGSPWADHIAVRMYLDNKVSNLRLFLPAEWNDGKFKDNGVQDFKTNPGGTLNYYHRKFFLNTNINSLSDLHLAKYKGAEFIIVDKGFHARNALVAKSDFILAMTFGTGNEVKDGGTADTIKRYLQRVNKEGIFDKSFHYNLTDGKFYIGCKSPRLIS